MEFCERHKLDIQFLRDGRYTWKRPGDTERFQIDYIMVKQRFRNSVKKSYAYPGADCDSDQNLIIAKWEKRLKK